MNRSPPVTQDLNRYASDIQAFCLKFDRALPLQTLLSALGAIGATCGQHLLRLKGIVDIEGTDNPLVIHGVQHMLFPTTTLDAWPDGMRQSRLVFIVRHTEVDYIARTLKHLIHSI